MLAARPNKTFLTTAGPSLTTPRPQALGGLVLLVGLCHCTVFLDLDHFEVDSAPNAPLTDGSTCPGEHDANCRNDEPCLPTSCGGHGECADDTGTVVCACHDGYLGPSCEGCDKGFHWAEEHCVRDETCDDRDCAGHGICFIVGGISSCACQEGYEGDDCEECCPGYGDPGDGSCVRTPS